MNIYIETDHLILRDLLDTDLEGMYELDSDPLVHKYLGNTPISTKQQAQDNIDFIRHQYKVRGIGRWAVVEKSTGEFTGWSGIKLNQGPKDALNGYDNFYDIGYRFIPRYWGKGFATESALKALEYGFNQLRLDTIYGAADVENIASNTVLKNIGLKFVNNFIYHDGATIAWYALNNKDYAKTMS